MLHPKTITPRLLYLLYMLYWLRDTNAYCPFLLALSSPKSLLR